MKKFLILSSILFVFFSYTNVAHAQFNEIGKTQISLETVPITPGPNEQVAAILDSYGTDLNLATITWYLNGKKMLSGKGQKGFSFRTGLSNTTTVVEAFIVTSTGEEVTKTYQIKPSTVDLIWQNDSYVPPFYKGKALYSYQNKITFVAVPHILNSSGKEINPNSLTYKWTKNGTVLGDFSGYGKNTYTMISSIIARPITMEVEVTSSNNDVAQSSISVVPVDPVIMLYEKSPLYGFMFDKALIGDVTFNNLKEIEITSVPFFFGSTYAKNSSLPYKWNINYTRIDNDTSKTSRIFRPKEGTSGMSNISVSIDNTDEVLQSASGNFNIQFVNTASTENQTF